MNAQPKEEIERKRDWESDIKKDSEEGSLCRHYMLGNRNKTEKESDDAKGAMSIDSFVPDRCVLSDFLYIGYTSLYDPPLTVGAGGWGGGNLQCSHNIPLLFNLEGGPMSATMD